MNFLRIILALSLFVSVINTPFAHATEINEPSLNYGDLDVLAKGAIVGEVTALNRTIGQLDRRQSLNRPPLLAGYKNSDLRIFQTLDKSEGVDPQVLYDVCVLTLDTVSALSSKRITKETLTVNANINAVNAMKSQMNAAFFKVVESACLNSRTRFMQRLGQATVQGQALHLNASALKNITDIVFFPTNYAKPSFEKSLMRALPVIINGAFFIGAAASVIGLPAAGVWMSITTMSNSAFSVASLVHGQSGIIPPSVVSEVQIENGIRIDRSPLESPLP